VRDELSRIHATNCGDAVFDDVSELLVPFTFAHVG
jgi:hypothetical protein